MANSDQKKQALPKQRLSFVENDAIVVSNRLNRQLFIGRPSTMANKIKVQYPVRAPQGKKIGKHWVSKSFDLNSVGSFWNI